MALINYSAKILSFLIRDRKVLIYSLLYIERYCYDSFEMIGILCGYYICFVLL